MSESQKQNTAISFTTYVLMINNSMQKQNLSEPTRHKYHRERKEGRAKRAPLRPTVYVPAAEM
jgi:hypothetical protein